MTQTEIEQLIADYNIAEAARIALLEQIYRAIRDDRKGSREVRFGESGGWTNCWGHEWDDPRGVPRFVGSGQIISSYRLGDPA